LQNIVHFTVSGSRLISVPGGIASVKISKVRSDGKVKAKNRRTNKNLVSIQAAYEKVPNVATLSDGFVRLVANDIAQQKTLQ
jgi:hypothetical protein